MVSKDFYKTAVNAYGGDEEARAEWIARVFPLAVAAAAPYNVRPELVLARSVMESGWGSDRYEEVMEARFGVWMACKAQYHNNLMGMVAYGGNDQYAPGVPVPRWNDYKTTFHDYAPHGDMSGQYIVRVEEFKEYRSVEDCFEDFCAVIRSQSARRGEKWPDDLRGQLLSVGRGYTPEGAPAPEGSGLVYMWQCETLKFIQKYGLSERGSESMNPAKMTTKNFEKHIVAAYRYAHENCSYGPSDRVPVPGADGKLDCVGLVFRALYTMNRYSGAHNINDVGILCEQNGMKKSTDPNDAWRRHGVVCMQDDHLKGTQHISHVFYSYGGKSADCISKYDLGSDARIKAAQPFQGVPVNEWKGRRHFFCMFYLPDEKTYPEAVPDYDNFTFALGVIDKPVGMYEGPGTEHKKIRKLEEGEIVVYGLRVTNSKGHDWRRVDLDENEHGYVYHTAVRRTGRFTPYKAHIKKDLDDGFAAVRIGAGVGCSDSFRLTAGTPVTVDGEAEDKTGGEWLHVCEGTGKNRRRGWVAAGLLVKD